MAKARTADPLTLSPRRNVLLGSLPDEGHDSDRQRALSEGFALYIPKPVGGRELANAVAGLVSPMVAAPLPH